jgi:UDP-N-acetylmuramate dehydrogenase
MMNLLGEKIRQHEPLAKYTAARLGGAAEWLYIADESNAALVDVVTAAWASDLPVRILGGGANVLVSDAGVAGLVIIDRIAEVQQFGQQLRVTAGTSLTRLAHKCASLGLSGFEWSVSVPGTIGGAVVNNAGAHGGDLAGSVRAVTLLDRRAGVVTYTHDDLAYGYRTSSLKRRADRDFIVLDALLAFVPDTSDAVEARMAANIAHRKATQPPGASLGSIFKNPPGDYAGRLIEAAGLKGFRLGGAMVSPVHANFFINTGDTTTASDYYALIEHVRAVVEREQGIRLEIEIELVGDW